MTKFKQMLSEDIYEFRDEVIMSMIDVINSMSMELKFQKMALNDAILGDSLAVNKVKLSKEFTSYLNEYNELADKCLDIMVGI